MILRDIYKLLNQISDFTLQEDWDNSGVQVGSLNQTIEKIYLSLDITTELVSKMDENSLLITHHPLVFKPLSSVVEEEFPSNLIYPLIAKKSAHIAMHTNFDKTHLNKYVVEQVLGYKVFELDEFIIYFEVRKNFDEFCDDIKKKLGIKNLNVVKNTKFVDIAAITTGSGASLQQDVKVDCFLTGDIKYHDAMLACEMKKSLIDIKHYESEIFFAKCLQKELKNYEIEGIISNSKNPFIGR